MSATVAPVCGSRTSWAGAKDGSPAVWTVAVCGSMGGGGGGGGGGGVGGGGEALANGDLLPAGDVVLQTGEGGGEREAGSGGGGRGGDDGGRGEGAGFLGFFAGGAVNEVVGPRVADDGAAGGEDDEDGEGPEADDVVPVPVAGAAGGAADEPEGRAEETGVPGAGPPEPESGDGEEEEGEVGGAGDGFAGGAVIA